MEQRQKPRWARPWARGCSFSSERGHHAAPALNPRWASLAARDAPRLPAAAPMQIRPPPRPAPPPAPQLRAGATLRFPRSLPIDRDDPDAFKLQVHRLSLKTQW
jgi:hypothetical protein